MGDVPVDTVPAMGPDEAVDADGRSAVRRFFTHPALLVLLLAPYFGEGLSGSTPPLDLILPWNLALMMALYGCGALLCREVAHRFGLGFGGLILLGAAYGVWEEALVDRYWFYPKFWQDSGVGHYSVTWHTNVLLAVHLTAFHTAISICSSVLVVEWLVPTRHRSWTNRPGLAVAAVALASTPVIYGEFDRHPPVSVLLAAGALMIALIAAAFVVGRRSVGSSTRHARVGSRGIGIVAFACVLAHWIATYGIAATPLIWPLGLLVAVAPIVLGAAVIRTAVEDAYSADGVRVVVGLVTFFAILDALVGLGGRYDLTIGGLVTGYAAGRLLRSARSVQSRTHRPRSVSPE
jgi:hypothetical protein